MVVVSRRDLHPGSQSVQAGHALSQFIFDHPDISKNWFVNSNYLVFLSIKDEKELESFALKLKDKDIKHSCFYEPDLSNQLTAICIEPSDKTRRIVSNLPLMLKEFSNNKN